MKKGVAPQMGLQASFKMKSTVTSTTSLDSSIGAPTDLLTGDEDSGSADGRVQSVKLHSPPSSPIGKESMGGFQSRMVPMEDGGKMSSFRLGDQIRKNSLSPSSNAGGVQLPSQPSFRSPNDSLMDVVSRNSSFKMRNGGKQKSFAIKNVGSMNRRPSTGLRKGQVFPMPQAEGGGTPRVMIGENNPIEEDYDEEEAADYVEEDPLIEKDKMQMELRHLAIRIQKNGGLEITDKRQGGHLYKSCFSTHELVTWIMDEFLVSIMVASAISVELWKYGLISHVLHSNTEFEVSKTTLFQVAHPYAINLLLLPSEMEELYGRLRSVQGPRLSNHVVRGNLVKRSFSASDLMDWLVSVYQLSPRERAKQVAQQLMNEGYLFEIFGSEKFLESSKVFFQHKHDYLGNVHINTERGRALLKEVALRYEGKVSHLNRRNRLTVRMCLNFLRDIVSDCSTFKARHILRQLERMKLVDIQRRIGQPGDEIDEQDDITTMLLITKGGKPVDLRKEMFPDLRNNAFEEEIGSAQDSHGSKQYSDVSHGKNYQQGGSLTGSLLGSRFSGNGSITNFITPLGKTKVGRFTSSVRTSSCTTNVLDENGKVSVIVTVKEREYQRRAVELMNLLEAGTDRSKRMYTRAMHRRNTLHRVIQLLLAVLLWVQVINISLSTLSVTESIKLAIDASPKFLSIASLDDMTEWLLDVQKPNNLAWRGNQFHILEEPDILVDYADPIECGVIRGIANEISSAAEEEFGNHSQGCYLDDQAECGVYEPCIFSDRIDSSWADLNETIMKNQQKEGLVITRMALEVVLLDLVSEVVSIVNVKAVAHFGPTTNLAQVEVIPVYEIYSTDALNILTFVVITAALVDFIIYEFSWSRGKHLMQATGVLALLRIGFGYIGAFMYRAHSLEVMAYLDAAKRNEVAPGSFSDMYAMMQYARVYLIISMFLSSLNATSLILGDRFNIFASLKKTFISVFNDVKILIAAFTVNFASFTLAVYGLMNSQATQFETLGTSSITLYGALFGGAPWKVFYSSRSVTNSMGFLFMAGYLTFFIFVLLNMFVAMILESHQQQKQHENVLKREFTRHLHASEIKGDISFLTMSMGRRIGLDREQSRRAPGPLGKLSETGRNDSANKLLHTKGSTFFPKRDNLDKDPPQLEKRGSRENVTSS